MLNYEEKMTLAANEGDLETYYQLKQKGIAARKRELILVGPPDMVQIYFKPIYDKIDKEMRWILKQ